MGTCCTRKPVKPTTIQVLVDENAQTKFMITNPKFKCQSFYPVQYICTNKTCNIRPVYYCGNKLCLKCPKIHEQCSCFKVQSLTELLQRRCNQNQNFVQKISSIQTEVIGKIKHNRLQRIQNMLVSNLSPEYAEVILKLYFNKPGTEIKRMYVADLISRMKENNNVQYDDEEILKQYRDLTLQFAHSVKEIGDTVLKKGTSTVALNIEQKISRQVRDYGYTGITNHFRSIQPADKERVTTLQIFNTCKLSFHAGVKYASFRVLETKYRMQLIENKVGNIPLIKAQIFFKTSPVTINLVSAQMCINSVVNPSQSRKYLLIEAGQSDKHPGQIKPFAEELAGFKNVQSIELSFYHSLLDETYFRDVIDVLNNNLPNLKTLKLKISPQTNKLVSKYNWTHHIRDGIQVEIIKEEIKSGQLLDLPSSS